eukprot:TRINITY_DN27965_c0_g1_i1.p1 TRINITY_DN27965_c0_g1~~TRINITY_DN27965_c0_g1_i1.p1  ORF type:complete len:1178 (-),score=220.11 TRINITY_DN27965_c0_g1_i1:177-3710(-)
MASQHHGSHPGISLHASTVTLTQRKALHRQISHTHRATSVSLELGRWLRQATGSKPQVARPAGAHEGEATAAHAQNSKPRASGVNTATSAAAAVAALATSALPSRSRNISSRRLFLGGVTVIGAAAARLGLEAQAQVLSVRQSAAKTKVFDGTILVSPSDPRQYRVVTLGNGLRILLASDSKATTAAAALSVHAGFYQDPEELPGLAHFCEHMLFLGNEEYAEENSFQRFLSANGGSQNAFTSETVTTYFFNSSPSVLQESLRRFSAFFKSPLFTASAVEREVNAIDSENAKNKQSDGFRLSQLLKSTARDGHPERHFGTGNRETLLAKGPDEPRKALLKFFDEYYDPGEMALCVVGKESLDMLQAWAETSFAGIPRRGRAAVGMPGVKPAWQGVNPYPPIFSPRGSPLLLEAVPVGVTRTVSMQWCVSFDTVAAEQEWALSKPHEYIAHIVGHEGPGSLLSFLKNKGWVNKNIVGVSLVSDDFAIFRASFDVSEEGLRRKEDIFGAVFGVLRRLQDEPLKSIPGYTIEECRQLAEIQWRFAEKKAAQEVALELVDNMQSGLDPSSLDPSKYLAGSALLLDPPAGGPSGGSLAQAIASFLKKLTPEQARYSVVAQEVASHAGTKEKWYGTQYCESEIPAAVTQDWATRPVEQLLPDWHVPGPNIFVPRNFNLVRSQVPEGQIAKAAADPPIMVRDDARWRAFFKADQAFGVPKATVLTQVWFSGESMNTPQSRVAARLWQLCVADRLSEEYYSARLAGLNVGCGISVSGLSLSFSGYSDRLPVFVGEVLGKIRAFAEPTAGEFARALDLLQREQSSFDVQQPFVHAVYFARLATVSPECTIESLRAATAGASAFDVSSFARRVWSAKEFCFGQAIIHGNLSRDSLGRILAVLDTLPFKGAGSPTAPTAGAPNLIRSRFTKLAPGQEVLQMRKEPNDANVNNALLCTYFMGDTPEDGLKSRLLESILRDSFYSSLRTQQQLGYIVQSSSDMVNNLSRISLVVQSSVQTPDRLLETVDIFLAGWRAELRSTSARQLDEFKAGLREQLLRPDERLGSETNRWWNEIAGFQYVWRRAQDEAALIDSLSLADLVRCFDERLAAAAQLRRRNVTAVFAAGPNRDGAMAKMTAAAQQRGATIFDDPLQFNNSMPKWPMRDRSPSESVATMAELDVEGAVGTKRL